MPAAIKSLAAHLGDGDPAAWRAALRTFEQAFGRPVEMAEEEPDPATLAPRSVAGMTQLQRGTNAGQSPKFKVPNGPVIGLDVGLITFDVTFDHSTGDFVSFSVVRVAGQRPALDSQICAALT